MLMLKWGQYIFNADFIVQTTAAVRIKYILSPFKRSVAA
jgi:hypothetical protein